MRKTATARCFSSKGDQTSDAQDAFILAEATFSCPDEHRGRSRYGIHLCCTALRSSMPLKLRLLASSIVPQLPRHAFQPKVGTQSVQTQLRHSACCVEWQSITIVWHAMGLSAPAAYGRSLCSQGRPAAPRRQLFLAQVVEMCTSYAWNRFCQQMQQAMAISAHPMCGHCLFQWSWVLAALPRCDSSRGFGRVNCVIEDPFKTKR